MNNLTEFSYKKNALEMVAYIEKANRIAISSHVNPDGDNLGSCLCLYDSLVKLGKDVVFLGDDEVPEDFLFLKNIEKRRKSHEGETFDLFISLDSSDSRRFSPSIQKIYQKAKNTINIDHHKTNEFFADVNIVSPDETSTGELLYKLLKAANFPITSDGATALYTAISTDTGSFQYDSMTSTTHRVIADLIDLGAKFYEVTQQVYQSRSKEKTALLFDVLSTISYDHDDQVAIVQCSLNMLEKTGAKSSDTEGIIEFVRNIKPVQLAVLLKERKDEVKFSLRSKDTIDCTKIAEFFGGGGHIRASGGSIKGDLAHADSCIRKRIDEVFLEGNTNHK